MENKLTVEIMGRYNPKFLWYYGDSFALSNIDLRDKRNPRVTIGGMDVSLDSCRLMLCPLSSITDEDIAELLKIESYHPQLREDWENIKDDLDIDSVRKYDGGLTVAYTHICFIGEAKLNYDELYIETIADDEENGDKRIITFAGADFLRSKLYDIDKLNEQGIAVYIKVIQDGRVDI